MKFYIHHFYNKPLFYGLFHNTTDREYFIDNDEGTINCKYKGVNLEIVFKQEISFEDDGYHVLDYFSAFFDSGRDPKIGMILRDTSFMERENQQLLKIFINLLKDCPENQRWLITYFRTEKILHSLESDEAGTHEKIVEVESLLNQLSQHYIINDNMFLDERLESMYENFYFTYTNSIFQWNYNLNLRWYYEFKSIFDKLNFDYDLMYSVRNHKIFRVNFINALNELKNPKIYLQRSDTLSRLKTYKTNSVLVSNDVKCSSIYGETDFEDLSYIQNIKNGLDLFFRVLPKAKMQILDESWAHSEKDFATQYISEKILGLILSGIPFISTHDYPLIMIQKILELPNHPFFEDSKKYKGNPKLLCEFVERFMENFDENYLLCKEWSNLAFEKFMNKLNTENSLLDLILENKLKDKFNKKGLI